MTGRVRIGVDLGGTKIEVMALDDAGRERHRRRVATPRDDYAATIEAVRALVVDTETLLARTASRTASSTASRTASVGVAMPGSRSPTTGLVRNANSTWLNGRRIDDDLATALGRPVRVANDADCFALSEAIDGAGVGHRVVFGVILGTGVGGGIVIDGTLLGGRNGIAGEWGHQSLPRVAAEDLPMPRCWCGRNGCVETYLSGPAMLADHRAHGSAAASTRAIVEDAGRGDAPARATLDRYRQRLAKSLAMVVGVFDPDVIVLGGGLSNVDALYEDATSSIGAFAFSDSITTPVVRNRHGDSSGVRGAARLWP